MSSVHCCGGILLKYLGFMNVKAPIYTLPEWFLMYYKFIKDSLTGLRYETYLLLSEMKLVE